MGVRRPRSVIFLWGKGTGGGGFYVGDQFGLVISGLHHTVPTVRTFVCVSIQIAVELGNLSLESHWVINKFFL